MTMLDDELRAKRAHWEAFTPSRLAALWEECRDAVADEDEHRCQQCGRPIHLTKTLCADCEYPVVDEEGRA
jgi:5-methylcytosine-specific restriction endonuclease McrA